MKKNLVVLALFVATALSTANATIVVTGKISAGNVVTAAPPPAVTRAFTSIFGNAAVREWKLRSNGQWRAHFVRNGIKWEATFSASGALMKSEPA